MKDFFTKAPRMNYRSKQLQQIRPVAKIVTDMQTK